MREYRFTNAFARDTVDLTEYADIIKNAVAEIAPNATVKVYSDRYTIDDITRIESVLIGRLLSKTALSEYCTKVEISRLFYGQAVEGDDE